MEAIQKEVSRRFEQTKKHADFCVAIAESSFKASLTICLMNAALDNRNPADNYMAFVEEVMNKYKS